MSYNGQAPAPRRGLPLSDKAREVLDAIDYARRSDTDGNAPEELLRLLYEPALAVAAAINLVRSGNTSMAPFIGAGGVVLSKVLEPIIENFGEGDMTFEQVFERIGIPVVSFSDLPEYTEDTRADMGYAEDEDIPEDVWADDGGHQPS